MVRKRYALITVDVEAQPGRASDDHVNRLVWGEHQGGTAGVREMCSAADEVSAKLVFFVDACGVYLHGRPFSDAVRWMVDSGHDVQLHTHSEFLPDAFWHEHGFEARPRLLNQYDDARAFFTIRYFSEYLSSFTRKQVSAFRGGSFRWNSGTLHALAELGIPLSFNNSMWAFGRGACPFATPTSHPFMWSNGVIEVPLIERKFPFLGAGKTWGMLSFPASQSGNSPPWRVLWPYLLGRDVQVMVVLVHSWSLLHWDERGFAAYRGRRRQDEFRSLLKTISKDYEIITTNDLLELCRSGEIELTSTIDAGSL